MKHSAAKTPVKSPVSSLKDTFKLMMMKSQGSGPLTPPNPKRMKVFTLESAIWLLSDLDNDPYWDLDCERI